MLLTASRVKTAERLEGTDQQSVVQAQLSEEFLLYIAKLC